MLSVAGAHPEAPLFLPQAVLPLPGMVEVWGGRINEFNSLSFSMYYGKLMMLHDMGS